jgi:hypothetical protein
MYEMVKVVMNLIRNWGKPRLFVWLLGFPLRWGPRWQKGVSFTSKLWSLVMDKSSQVIKVEEYVYKKCIRDYGVKKKKNM